MSGYGIMQSTLLLLGQKITPPQHGSGGGCIDVWVLSLWVVQLIKNQTSIYKIYKMAGNPKCDIANSKFEKNTKSLRGGGN